MYVPVDVQFLERESTKRRAGAPGHKSGGASPRSPKTQTMIRLKHSWADEVEDLDQVAAWDGKGPMLIGRTEYWEKEDALESLKTFAPERLYCAWGNGAEVARSVFSPIVSIVNDLESVKELIRTRGTGALSAKNATKEECIRLSVSFLNNVYGLLTELAKLFRMADSMMLPLDPGVTELQGRIAAIAEDYSPSYGSYGSGGHKGIAARLKQAYLERNRAYCVHASAIVGIARIDVQAGHRKLIEFRIRFDKANPDVAAWMGR